MEDFQWVIFRFLGQTDLIKHNHRNFVHLFTGKISLSFRAEVMICLIENCLDILCYCILGTLKGILSNLLEASQVVIGYLFLEIFCKYS